MSFIPILGRSPSYLRGLSRVNLLNNPGFETAGAGGADIWAQITEAAGDGALANEVVIVHEGNDAAKLTAGASANTTVRQASAITVVTGKRYWLLLWTAGDGTYAGRYSVANITLGGDVISATATGVTGAAYAAVVKVFTIPASTTSINVVFHCPTTDTGIAYFDATELRALV